MQRKSHNPRIEDTSTVEFMRLLGRHERSLVAYILAVGASDTFTVRLDTTTTGTKSGHLSFNTNDADERRFNFRILGKVL